MLDEDADQGPLHADIKLIAGGEFIGIFSSDANGNLLIDGLDFGPQETDISFGRFPDGTGPFMELDPTPGSTNHVLTSTAGTIGEDIHLSIYPNPFHSKVHVVTIGDLPLSSHIIVLNVYGQKVMDENWQRSTILDASQLPDGIYFLGVGSEATFQVVSKLVKH